MIKKLAIDKLLDDLKAAYNAGMNLEQYAQSIKLNKNYFISKKKYIEKSYKNGDISEEDYNSLMELYSKFNIKSDAGETDNRAEINIERDAEGKITKYAFKIYKRDKDPLIGYFSREEMREIYRLYSCYGSNITQREVSRGFPEFSLCDFKSILRTFNITKASSPFPPHMIEEMDKDKLLEIQFREKENDFLRSYEVEKVRNLDLQVKKYMKENADLKEQMHSFKDFLENIDLSNIPAITPKPSKSTKDLFIWLSDMHIGASVSDKSIYYNKYDQDEIHSRLTEVISKLATEDGYDNIIVCNIGDSLDGFNSQTTRGGNILPQNMNNKEQLECFMDEMVYFMDGLSQIPNNGVYYYAVGESNHGGDFEYAAQLALEVILNERGVITTIFDKFIGVFTHKGINYVICHGKDNNDMFKNWPLVLNDKTENYINKYLDSQDILRAVVIKGDLHQSATSYCGRFVYKSVGSLFGSSEWIHKNFGDTKASCDYSIVEYNENEDANMLDGRIVLN